MSSWKSFTQLYMIRILAGKREIAQNMSVRSPKVFVTIQGKLNVPMPLLFYLKDFNIAEVFPQFCFIAVFLTQMVH